MTKPIIPQEVLAVKRTLPFVIKYHVAKGYMPSNREIAKGCGYKSAYTANLHIQHLARLGFIKIARTKSGRAKNRAITILKIK